MAQHSTRKTGNDARKRTLANRKAAAYKRGAVRVTASGRAR